ncbi:MULTISPECIES: NADP-dependent malic enzyme [unclassified Novosphingobium]|jgi:malate dehydrogenase (oxaloacetate-decarboxylating)(NADP+)|uniref:NADP-dependent malic enzyme n=1 Tax=unclassified Novosphingobium TaxID=2644732 RepID=UPI00061C2210|nr:MULTISPECIES: NADP-dependent malic enzyme [unclassified Novosphingobium]RQW42563.1 NADP-dependent malic enzyme [Novosphingobium sp. LASN5T]GAO54569.1 NADP-dependent malic enzyme [Novosphingobium sp. MD-1]
MSEESNVRFTEREALFYHNTIRPGKIEIIASKPMATQRDLSLAYSPGVAVPVRAIADDPATAYDYTAKGNLVAVISNGTAILGLGNLGALASKPVMEGKAVLFKRFADVDSIDIEVATEDPEAFINAVALLEPSFGGINLEDIKAPECFIIEQALRERLKIPVMHDDQHGTAIITAAGLVNACHLTGRDLKDVKVVVNGAGAAAIACTALIKAMGVRHDNVIMCDRSGTIWRGRSDGMDQWKSAHAVDTPARTLEEALVGADIFLGLSAAGALKPEYVKAMAPQPIIFAMANPDPEITPPEAKAARPDCIIATGRSDYPNQVNNVLGFPFIFRGALDVRATAINEEMKIAAAEAIAELARRPVPEEVAAAYGGQSMQFGHDYIIPAPFDPRLMEVVSSAVAKAAMDSGVAMKPIEDFDVYRHDLKARLNPTTSVLTNVYAQVKRNPKRVVFAEAENEVVLRAAVQFRDFGYGEPVLVGRDQVVREKLVELGIGNPDSYEIHNSAISPHVPAMVEMLYERLQRRGFLERDVRRMVNQDRNVFASALVKLGHADALITGMTRTFSQTLKEVRQVLDPAPGKVPFGIHLMVAKNYTVFLADTTVNERPSAEDLAHIAVETADVARRMGHEPRVAFLSFSTFGNPMGRWVEPIRGAVSILDEANPGFEYEGEVAPDAALNPKVMANYPFSRLSGPANVLIMPGLQSANISAKLLRELAGNAVIGPMLLGMEKPVQIAPMTAIAPDILTLAVLAAAGVAQ